MKNIFLAGACAAMWGVAPAHAQMIGSYDNFDCFNDTGTTAEGFEIDVEDVLPSDVTRIFPDNFPVGQPYVRWPTPVRGWLKLVHFPDGHTGITILYEARYRNGAWHAQWGNATMPGTSIRIGDGTPYVANPTYTGGDSCWTLGLGAAYPASGCDHFGFSLSGRVPPGKITMHWLVPDPTHVGSLMQTGTEISLPPGPVLSPVPQPVGAPPVVHVVAAAPEQPQYEVQGLCTDAYWLRTFTSYSPAHANLNALQKNLVPLKGPTVTTAWHLLQRCPPSVDVDKAESENDTMPAGAVQVVKRHEYFAYNGAYDSNHEVTCGGDQSCDVPVVGLNGLNELGDFKGAHNAAYDVK